MDKIITSAAELDAATLGDTFKDRDGDVWMVDTHTPQTVLVSPETTPMRADRVLAKWGPLTRVGSAPEPTPTTLPSEEELARRLHRRDCDCPEPDAPDHEVDYRDLAQTAIGMLPGRSEQVVKAEAWDEGYGTGVHDERMAAEADIPEYREPARTNPYRVRLIPMGTPHLVPTRKAVGR